MEQPVQIALIGVTGYGAVHARRLLAMHAGGLVRIAAFVEPAPDRDPAIVGLLRAAGAVHYTDLSEVPELAPVEAAVIAAPIHLHRPLCLAALERGWHVLLEKPAAATIQDLAQMIEARRRAGRIVAVNFQHTARPGFRTLLGLIQGGRLGTLRQVTCQGVWNRDDVYYDRTAWAGRLRTAAGWVLDGTVMNPFAHLVNNGLLAASPELGRPAAVTQVTAELYHANPIESEDTSCLRILTEAGVEVLFFATLAGPEGCLPGIRVKGSAGTATWDYEDRVKLTTAGGCAEIPPPAPGPGITENFLDAVRGAPVALCSPLEASVSHLKTANGAFLSSWPPAAVPAAYTTREPTSRGTLAVLIPGIVAIIERAGQEARLFSELGVPWTRPGQTIDLTRLTVFAPPTR